MDKHSFDNLVIPSLTRDEIILSLQQLGIKADLKQTTARLRNLLKKRINLSNPVQVLIDSLSEKTLKSIWKHFSFKGYFQYRERTKQQMVNFFLKLDKPMETLKSFLESEKFEGLPLVNPKNNCPLQTENFDKTFMQTENFKGIPLRNSGNQCYAISSVNLLFSSEILCEQIEQRQKTMHDKTMHDKTMQDKTTVRKNPAIPKPVVAYPPKMNPA